MNLHISLPTQKPVVAVKPNAIQQVAPGEIICECSGFMRGHGTYIDKGYIVASVAGVVERVNKFICVRPLKSRFTGDVADVVVGRITAVQQNRWKVDVQARQDAVLHLSAVDLPGDVRRRKTIQDQLQMRSIYVENDMISAECQQIGDNSISIHTRLKYGKLNYGQCITVPPSLIKRSKTHFVELECGIDMILGNNGCIWLSPSTPSDSKTTASSNPQEEEEPQEGVISTETRLNMARVHNAIVILAKRSIAIHSSTIKYVYNLSIKLELHPKQMMQPQIINLLTENAAAALELS
uniref:Uncharacterized protein n=1 Tax=Arcella intermedia TaxID=1963864 RepID=A0A6B2LBZ6_9EUKA